VEFHRSSSMESLVVVIGSVESVDDRRSRRWHGAVAVHRWLWTTVEDIAGRVH